MRQVLALFLLAFVTACGASPSGGGDPGGTGGAGGVGGGGGIEADPPVVEFLAPGDGEVFVEPDVVVRGHITAPNGLARLEWRDPRGALHFSQAAGETEFAFEFEVVLQEGSNRIEVVAIDSLGDETRRHLEAQLDNPPGRDPTIEYFRADRPYADLGESVRLEWKVSGTRPIQIVLRSWDRDEDVSRLAYAERRLQRPGVETFELFAVGASGYSRPARVSVGVGEQLQIWPTDATIAVGERLALFVENSPSVEWTTSGGTLETHPPVWAEFYAEAPGVYGLTATTQELQPRIATATIRVTNQTAPTAGLQGIGGQFGYAPYGGVGFSGGVDAQGTIWLPAEGGFAFWSSDSASWQLVEAPDLSKFSSLRRDPGGELLALTHENVLRLDADTRTWSPHMELPPELTQPRFLRDGRIFAFRFSFGIGKGTHPPLLLISGPTSVEEIELPEGAWPAAFESDGQGGIYLAAKVDEQTHVFHLADPSSGWRDTGPVPRPDEPRISDLVVLDDGSVFLVGDTLSTLTDDGWQSVDTPSDCMYAYECAIRMLFPRADDTLLLVTHQNVYRRTQEGTFVPLAEAAPEMQLSTGYGIQGIFEADDGTLVQGGDAGVFTLPPQGTTWAMVGTSGSPPGTEVNHLLFDQGGGLVVATSRRSDHPNILHRLSPEGVWEGLGAEAFEGEQGEVVRLAQGGAGTLVAFTGAGAMHVLDWSSGTSTRLPSTPRFSRMERESIRLAVAPSGSIFVDGTVQGSREALRLAPGADTWMPVPSLPYALDFVHTADGTLWAFSLWPRRLLADGTWQPVSEGLPIQSTSSGMLAADGEALLLAEPAYGVFRLTPGATTWQRLGYGEPNRGASHIAAGGGRIWAIRGSRLYELEPTTQSWVSVSTWLPSGARIGPVAASPKGTLFFSPGRGLGLFQTIDRE